MKKYIPAMTLGALLVGAMSFTGCSSTKINLQELSPVAIVSVTSNDMLPWYEEDEDGNASTGGLLSSMAGKTFDSTNPEVVTANSRIDGAYDTLRDSFEKAGIAVLSTEKVTGTPSYKAEGNQFGFISTKVVADGLKNIGFSGSRKNRDICSESGAEATVYADFEFFKLKVNTGLGTYGAKALVRMKVYVNDKAGHLIIRNTYEAVSGDTVVYRNGSWDRQAVCDLFPGIIQEVVDSFISDYIVQDEMIQEMVPVQEETLEEQEEDFQAQGVIISRPYGRSDSQSSAASENSAE